MREIVKRETIEVSVGVACKAIVSAVVAHLRRVNNGEPAWKRY